jgi:hypothetical protein
MSAKLSYVVSIWMKCSKDGNTLQPCSGESMNDWKRLYIKRLDNVTLRVLRKSSGCNENECTGSLVKIETEMDEPVFNGRRQNSILRVEKSDIEHLRGISGDMSRKMQYGTWETLASSKGLSYKETKWVRDGRESEETIVLMMIVQHNAIEGKGLYWVIAYKEKTEYVLQC